MEVITLWLAIDPSTPENGCMRVIPKSHHEPLPHERPKFPTPDCLLHERLRDAKVDESKAVDIRLEEGEFSIHHPFLIHGSNPNISRKRRCGFTIRLIPTTTELEKTEAENHPLYLLRGTDEEGTNSYEPIHAI